MFISPSPKSTENNFLGLAINIIPIKEIPANKICYVPNISFSKAKDIKPVNIGEVYIKVTASDNGKYFIP